MDFRNTLVIVLALFPALFFGQQKTDNSMSYKRFEGTIGSDISITANIVQLFEKLSGNYQYRYLEDDASMHYGKTIELSGKIDKNDTARLREYGSKTYTFSGLMSGYNYTGDWHVSSDRNVPFVMKEYYPNGSMPFDVHYLRSEGNLVKGNSDSPVAEIELTLLLPADTYINPGITDSVIKIITKSFFGSGFKTTHPDSMLSAFEEEYLDNYVKQNENRPETGGASFNWEKLNSMSVIYNNGYMLCLEYMKYAYSGGSHGMTNFSYDIIYLDDGNLLSFVDVFDEGTEEALSEMLTMQLRKDYSIPETVGLKEAGFFVDLVEPNQNIYVNGNGVGFLFNSYEIAPYSQGSTNIFLEFKQIQHLVKKGTPVYRMSQQM